MKRLVLLTIATVLPASAALANPIATDVLRIRQAPSAHNVQITVGHDSSVGGEVPVPGVVTRDGTALSLTWVPMSGSFTANTGSGLTGVAAVQTCDCDVPEGLHNYAVALGGTFSMEGAVIVVDPTHTGTADDAGPTDGDAGDTEVYPWEIPEPTEYQGLDCNVVCAAPVVEPVVEEPDVVESVPDTGGITGSTDTGTDAAGGGGCAAGGSGAMALLLALGALLSLALLRKRRV